MTMDDENSIYVGGLPYSATEETLSRVFNIFGEIVDVKIINDRSTRGKCYGFVTFRNPRSVDASIAEMDGKSIEGRAVRVNGVTSRGGERAEFGRQRFRHDMGRSIEWERGRGRRRDYRHFRFRNQERYEDRSRDREHSLDRDGGRDREYEHMRYPDEDERLTGEDQYHDKRLPDDDHEGGRDSDRNHSGDSDDGDRRFSGRDTVRRTREDNGYEESISDDYYNEDIKEELERSQRKSDDIKNEVEISQMEVTLEDKERLISDLQKKATQLEDSLDAAKTKTSNRKRDLNELHECLLQVQDYRNRLKTSEHELQRILNSAANVDSD